MHWYYDRLQIPALEVIGLGALPVLSVLLVLTAEQKNTKGIYGTVGIKFMSTIQLALNALIFRTNFKMEAEVGYQC